VPVLASQQRKILEDACTKGRRASERAVRAALTSLAVTADRPPAHLNEDDRQLRRGLRAKARQLGDEGDDLDLLVAECAYEQWHRLLFARFLAENNLLIHPEYHAPVTLEDCDELAGSLGEPDGWSVAARFAAEILPGIFRLDDPCVCLRLAPEGRLALEAILAGLPGKVFEADDALGWVYQFWQKDKKDEVNASERKIGGADLGPVTQLFTENYMVRFLLENSLGAWWATRHPDSPLVKEWEFLRFDDERKPAAGSFDGWPDHVAEVTVMDPCCGSGHFLVEAFGMLWRMRVDEEGLNPLDAQDAVLRDNLFGLELDPRCVQIAMFAVALAAWKAGGGWRELPLPNVACSGVPVKAAVEEWKALARHDQRLESALVRLHILFRDADTLGSLIDPKRAASGRSGDQESLDHADLPDVLQRLSRVAKSEAVDPGLLVLGSDAVSLSTASNLLSRQYTLVATNVPYLGSARQSPKLQTLCASQYPLARWDLATSFLQRIAELTAPGGCHASVSPAAWTFLKTFERFRRHLLGSCSLTIVARLGPGAFEGISGHVVQPVLAVVSMAQPGSVAAFDVLPCATPAEKANGLKHVPAVLLDARAHLRGPDARIAFSVLPDFPLLSDYAGSYWGIGTGDGERFIRNHWEVPMIADGWARFQGTFREQGPFVGRTQILFWESGSGALRELAEELRERLKGIWQRGQEAWRRRGVAVNQSGRLYTTLYTGEIFQNGVAAIVPRNPADLPAIWAFLSNPEYEQLVRQIDTKVGVTNLTLIKVPFDIERWREVARAAGPLPQPSSDDPTQWLFEGRPAGATEPLQVAVGRLLGFRWSEQPESDDLHELADDDGIVCLPSVSGERPAADRLHELLARSFGGTWSPARTRELLASSGSAKKDLESWLRDDFFKAHCQVFKNRPFVWQIWDGRKDGFSALVNYHRLDRPTLERLTYTNLGDWIERQTAAVRDDVPGAEERVAAARDLQRRLVLILEGERPFDIYVRWKSLADQPIGWEPDINDGVRANVRPFVEAGVLRSAFNIHWRKDRGKNPDGSERFNDLHFTNAQKRAARGSS